MSELKGMVVFAVSEPCEDGSFFIKKSIRDGSLAIFDEEKDADRQLRRNSIQGDVVNECLVIRTERARNANDEIAALTETSRLKELECQQLAQDKAELVDVLSECFEWLEAQTSIEYQEELNKFRELLEKHK